MDYAADIDNNFSLLLVYSVLILLGTSTWKQEAGKAAAIFSVAARLRRLEASIHRTSFDGGVGSVEERRTPTVERSSEGDYKSSISLSMTLSLKTSEN